jgi:aryl-alcohol dehydrogenase-like predicted oxidoreductase
LITKQAFGRSGHLSSRILLGAAAFSEVTQAEADAALELALSFGVNHVDVAASYGEAELRIGNWIGQQPFFLYETGKHEKEACEEIRSRAFK